MNEVETSEAVVEVRVHEVAQLFSSFDPSPFRERDLDDDAEDYIVGWARELPAKAPLRIVVHLPELEARKARELDIGAAIANYFAARAGTLDQELRELFRNGRLYLTVGLPVLVACLGASQFVRATFGTGPYARALEESLLIVGWVANWKPIETFLYDWLPLVRRRRLYRRLEKAPVAIKAQ
jgi:hypothetical protein